MEKALGSLGEACRESEIAFFGGSFTAIDREYMLNLLEATREYIDSFSGIRISTRPDYIDNDILNLLKKYNVTTIELGAQSTDDNVLALNRRGHTFDDIIKASDLIKASGFNLGLQMMTGLYGADFDTDYKTALDFVSMQPQCVRIYPTVVVKNTQLADYYSEGKYVPYTLEQSVELCSRLLGLFEDNNIDVIRVGLHYSDSLAESDLAHNYHPAFKELCENNIFRVKLLSALSGYSPCDITITVNSGSVSKLIGQKKSNINMLNQLGFRAEIVKDSRLKKYELLINIKDNR